MPPSPCLLLRPPAGRLGAPGAALARRMRRCGVLLRSALRAHHQLYDGGELDLFPHSSPATGSSCPHALRHVSLLALLRRVTGVRWVPLDGRSDEDARRAA
jgi:hypothetical protein